MGYNKPIPLKTEDNKPYWDAADKHKLVLQKCGDCQQFAHPPGPACPNCGSENVEWMVKGSEIQATVYSYIISYRPFLPGFETELPTIIALGQLNDTPEVKIMANILECNHEDVYVGMPIEMTWQDITEDRALPQWKKTNV